MIDCEPPLPALGSSPSAVAARAATSGAKVAFLTGAAATIDCEPPLPALGSSPSAVAARAATSGAKVAFLTGVAGDPS
jgi:hypothetical protein